MPTPLAASSAPLAPTRPDVPSLDLETIWHKEAAELDGFTRVQWDGISRLNEWLKNYPDPTGMWNDVDALMHRARTGILINVMFPGQRQDTFAYWQGWFNALRAMRNGMGWKLARKDTATALGLDEDSYRFPRGEIAKRLRLAGVEIAPDPVADLDDDAGAHAGNLDGTTQIQQFLSGQEHWHRQPYGSYMVKVGGV